MNLYFRGSGLFDTNMINLGVGARRSFDRRSSMTPRWLLLVVMHYGSHFRGSFSCLPVKATSLPLALVNDSQRLHVSVDTRVGFFQLSISLFSFRRRQMSRRHSGVVIDHLGVSILSLLTYQRHLNSLDLVWWCV